MIRFIAPGARLLALTLLLAFVAVAGPAAYSQTYSIVHTFAWTDGANPLAGLFAIGSTLYGTTSSGGTYGAGTIFEISSTGVETVMHQFGAGQDGANPEASLIHVAGSLYGTTSAGGASNAGTVFGITLSQGKESVLYSFTGLADGAAPAASLVNDASGNLYGTTSSGGANDQGTVFELIKPATASAPWTEKVLYSFGSGSDGADPVAGLIFDASGNLYGTTSAGGNTGNGIVFKLSPSTSGWTENVLYNFQLQADGGVPYAGVVMAAGKLYGATTDGGENGQIGGGTVFQLAPPASGSGPWTYNALYRIPGWGISGSFQNLLVFSGKIYATTHCDGSSGIGTIYELTEAGSKWTNTTLHEFAGGSDGVFSFSNLVLVNNSLYGTTKLGGSGDYGIVFQIALP